MLLALALVCSSFTAFPTAAFADEMAPNEVAAVEEADEAASEEVAEVEPATEEEADEASITEPQEELEAVEPEADETIEAEDADEKIEPLASSVEVATYQELLDAINDAPDNENCVIVLTDDIAVDYSSYDCIYIPANKDITLQNGVSGSTPATLKRDGWHWADLIRIEMDAKLTLDGIILTTQNTGASVFNCGTFVMESGEIVDCSNSGVQNHGTFTMNDGLISDNEGEWGTGGGVSNYGSFTMNDGTISNNTSGDGGGVYNAGTFTMNDGVITNNEATADGGGVYCMWSSESTAINGGVISGNKASWDGGGIYTYHYDDLHVGASVVFSGNSARAAYNRDRDLNTVYNLRIKGTNWTSPYTQGYNNYDINQSEGTALSGTTKELISFVLAGASASFGTSPSYNYIDVAVPEGTNLSSLTPVIQHNGASVTPTGAQNFNNEIYYTVMAQDGTTKSYRVKTRFWPQAADAYISFTAPWRIQENSYSIYSEQHGGYLKDLSSVKLVLSGYPVDTQWPDAYESGYLGDASFHSPGHFSYDADENIPFKPLVSEVSGGSKTFTLELDLAAVASSIRADSIFTIHARMPRFEGATITATLLIDGVAVASEERTKGYSTISYPNDSGASSLVHIKESGIDGVVEINPSEAIFNNEQRYTSPEGWYGYGAILGTPAAISNFEYTHSEDYYYENNTVDGSYWTIVDGYGSVATNDSWTQVTLDKTFLDTLDEGLYTLRVHFGDPWNSNAHDWVDVPVEILEEPQSAKSISTFTLSDGSSSFVGKIQGTNITVTVPEGTNVTSLTPSITHTGASISPASGVAKDFTNPVAYTVTALNNSTKTYTVQVLAVQPNTSIVSTAGQLRAAIDGAPYNEQYTIVLANSIDLDGEGLYIPDNKDIVLTSAPTSGAPFTLSNYDGHVIYIDDYATFTLDDVILTGDDQGVSNYGTFIMEDGVITGFYDGGVYNSGTFTMNGGAIIDNDCGYDGGGVFNWGIFTMNDGVISGNHASDCGGGVLNYDSFTMTGGTISNNTSDNEGGGVWSWGEVTIMGGIISDNSANNSGGGVYTCDYYELFVGAGAAFSGNSAGAAYNRRSNHDSVYSSHISCTSWSYGHTQGYNNYDINYTSGQPLAESRKDITSFELAGVSGNLDYNGSIYVHLFEDTDLSAVTPVIEHTGVSITPTGAQDFTDEVIYTVTAADGTTKTYSVYVYVDFWDADPSVEFWSYGISDLRENAYNLDIEQTGGFINEVEKVEVKLEGYPQQTVWPAATGSWWGDAGNASFGSRTSWVSNAPLTHKKVGSAFIIEFDVAAYASDFDEYTTFYMETRIPRFTGTITATVLFDGVVVDSREFTNDAATVTYPSQPGASGASYAKGSNTNVRADIELPEDTFMWQDWDFEYAPYHGGTILGTPAAISNFDYYGTAENASTFWVIDREAGVKIYDPYDDYWEWDWSTTEPVGVTRGSISQNGQQIQVTVNASFLETLPAGSYTLRVHYGPDYDDPYEWVDIPLTITGGGGPALQAPTIAGDSTISLTEGYVAFNKNYAITGNPAPTVSLVGAPAGASISASGVLSIPAGLSPGTYSFTIKAANSEGEATQAVTIEVASLGIAPIILGEGIISLTEGYAATTVSYAITGTPTPSLSVEGAPAGVSITSDGVLAIPANLPWGSYSFTIKASNVAGTSTYPVVLNIASVANQAPVFSGDTEISLTEGYTATTRSYGVTGTPVPVLSLDGAPAGISIAQDGVLTIGAGLSVGTYTFDIVAENLVATSTYTVAITVVEAPPVGVAPTIAGDAAIALTEGYVAFSKNYVIAGTPAPTVSLVGAPAGLSITAAGVLTIPAGLKVGSYSFTIKAENTAGTATRAVTITVAQASLVGVAPKITGDATITLTEGYAKLTKNYTIAGTPAPTVSLVGAPAGLSITAAGALTI
ncbi:MAG: hypothetical protein FWG00_05735, partial [Coriobacteriia bacterium]|nr:hypothetical protein [Coriobacteriia bacterium]